MRSSFLQGFMKSAAETDVGAPEVVGALAGAAGGYALAKGSVRQRLAMALLGGSVGTSIASGAHGLYSVPDFANLTEGEKEEIKRELERLKKKRNQYRVLAGGAAIGSAAVVESAMPMLLAAPMIAMGPHAFENARISRMADAFRGARSTQ